MLIKLKGVMTMATISTIIPKVQKVAYAIQKNKYITAISGGLMGLLPIMMIGSFSTLFAALPIPAYQAFIKDIGLYNLLLAPSQVTINILSLYAVTAIAYKLAIQLDKDGIQAGLIALLMFLIVTPLQTLESGASVIPMNWLGAAGLFVAMFIAILSTKIYSYTIDKKLVISLPESVPVAVGKTFTALIPSFINVIIFTAVKGIFLLTPFENAHSFVFNFIQMPLQGIGGTIGAVIFAVLIAQILWIFGIHGSMIVFSLINPILTPLALQNLEAYQAGLPLPNVVIEPFIRQYVLIGGSGATLGFCILMAFAAKSKQFKTMGRMALPASICGINEPIIFGIPIVLNTKLIIPFVAAPIVNCILAYILTIINVIPRLNGATTPFGTPTVISGVLAGGWQTAVFQVFLIALDLAIYYPFFKSVDKDAYDLETDS